MSQKIRWEQHVVDQHSFRPLSDRRRNRGSLVLVTLTLSGCVSHAPVPLEPREALEQLRQRSVEDFRVETDTGRQSSWFPLESDVQLADGLSLGEANALALFYAPELRAVRSDERIAAAQVLQAGVLANPELSVGPRLSTRDSALIFPAGISWELPLWGELDAASDAATARLAERTLRVVEVELQTLQQVRAAYLRLGRLRKEEAILRSVAASAEQTVRWVEGLQAAGELDTVSGFLVHAERDEVLAAIAKVVAAATSTRRELLALLGLLPDAPVEFTIDESAEALPGLGAADPTALLALPVLRAAEAAYAVAEAALRLELSKQYPSIRFGPQFESDRGDPTVGLGLSITVPLFDRNRGGIAAALEARERSRERYTATLLEASHAAARARDELAAAEVVLRIHRGGAMRDAESALRALDLRMRAGRADVVEVLAMQRAIARTRASVLELEERAAVARLRAAVASGLALKQPTSDDGMESEK